MNTDKQRSLDAYLDGDMKFEDLPEAVRAEESQLAKLLGTLRDEAATPVSLRQDVMDEIARLPRSRWQDLVNWFLRPWTVRFTPATASAVALATLVAFLLLPVGDSVETSTDQSAARVLTRFVFVAPEAQTVTLTGDWVGWEMDEIPMEELRGSGIWTVDIPVPPGIHEYSFVVNGSEWRSDALAASQVDDGFGRINSVLLIPAAEA